MKKIFICIAFLWTGLFGGMAQQCLPELTAFKIKNEAFRNSQLEDMAVWMTVLWGLVWLLLNYMTGGETDDGKNEGVGTGECPG